MGELPLEIQRSLRDITDPKLRAKVEEAAMLGLRPDNARLAEQEARRRQRIIQAETWKRLTDLATRALANEFGRECASAVGAILRDGHSMQALEKAARVVAEARRR
jgi:hypothetical protein